MKRIICHWTGGGWKASSVDKEHYHFLVEADGAIVKGDFPVSANIKVLPGKYAAHTRGTNKYSIGVSLCCMAGATEVPFNSGKYPMTKTQWEAMCKLVAKLCRDYYINVTPQTVLSHAEVEKTLGVKQRGKWDYTRLSWAPEVKGAAECGNLLRSTVKRYLNEQ